MALPIRTVSILEVLGLFGFCLLDLVGIRGRRNVAIRLILYFFCLFVSDRDVRTSNRI